MSTYKYLMQYKTSPIHYTEGHEYRSLCIKCKHYEPEIVISPGNNPYCGHICDHEDGRCIPGDCVISCVGFVEKMTSNRLYVD
jgi:hypothetical protein